MRLSKLIFAALFAIFAVLAGVFIATVAALTSVVLFLLGRARGDRRSPQRGPFPRPPAPGRNVTRDLDVIEVTATEVPADATSRL